MSEKYESLIWNNDIAFEHWDMPDNTADLWDSINKWIPVWKITIAIAIIWWIVYEVLKNN